jgi:predicted nucleotide-binding protein
MNDRESIQELIIMASQLKFYDFDGKDELIKKAEIVIKRVFGNTSKFLYDLHQIKFPDESIALKTKVFSAIFSVAIIGDLYETKKWEKGHYKIICLFNSMLTTIDETHLISVNPKTEIINNTQQQAVFIVHGHNVTMREAVARVIEKLSLKAIILNQEPNQGQTIIEKFIANSNVNFAVVLFSPDDIGYGKEEMEKSKYRARQNVILELGYFIGKLGRERVMLLHQEEANFEMPSDYTGTVYTKYDNEGRWQFELVKELKKCGYEVDANKLIC